MTLALGRAAGKSFDKLDKSEKTQVKRGIDGLKAIPPQPSGYKHLSGHPNWFRIRIGNYRVCYKIVDGNVYVGVIAHRRDVYRELERINS